MFVGMIRADSESMRPRDGEEGRRQGRRPDQRLTHAEVRASVVLEGCAEGGVVARTLSELGVGRELELLRLDPVSRVVGDGFDLTARPRLEGFEDDLIRLSPGEGENIHLFLEECRALYREMELVSKKSMDLMNLGQKLGFMEDFLLRCPRLRKYGGRSAKEVAHSFFTDPKLVRGLRASQAYGSVVLVSLGMEAEKRKARTTDL